jgi:hypothetical protein
MQQQKQQNSEDLMEYLQRASKPLWSRWQQRLKHRRIRIVLDDVFKHCTRY